MKFTKFFICAIILTIAMFSADKAFAAVTMGDDVLTLNITFHTQEIDTSNYVVNYKIIETTLDTTDVLNVLAKDLHVKNNGVAGFPNGSYLVVTDNIKTMVKSPSGQTWNVSSHLRYSVDTKAVLASGTPPPVSPGGVLEGLSYISLVHIHFEDADYVADFTGIANSQPTGLFPGFVTSLPSASGSGMLNRKAALITANANLTFQQTALTGPEE